MIRIGTYMFQEDVTEQRGIGIPILALYPSTQLPREFFVVIIERLKL